DQIMFHPPYIPEDLKPEWQTDLPEFSVFDHCHSHVKHESCLWPWGSLNIRPDGAISLCYLDMTALGHIRDISRFMRESWNGDYFRAARRLIAKAPRQTVTAAETAAPHPCGRCHAMGQLNFSV
ncbi:MAG TPA: SPASM domain-containing protein, partial [Elusimicrobiales bacterium]|nr:SPASM domain-containing protein [Elusimicrobiales bacterium]